MSCVDPVHQKYGGYKYQTSEINRNVYCCLCVSGKGLSNSGSQSSLRGAFPECILEDSGFEEPQEFRTRCSSMAGSLQRKPGEGVIMGPTRRRHSSAPNHVQPSDSDKNRTMLFQVKGNVEMLCIDFHEKLRYTVVFFLISWFQ